MALKRHLQFRRNESVYSSKAACEEAILGISSSELNDGEQIFGRYKVQTGETENDYKVNTMVGLVYKSGSTVQITISDAADVDTSIEAFSAKTINDVDITQVTSETGQYTSANADKYEITTTTHDGTTAKTDDFQLMFTPYSPSTLTVPSSIGDIQQGTTAAQLSQMTLSKLLDDMLFKTIYPTVSNTGSASITSSNFTNGSTVEAGATTSAKTVTSGFTISLNRGSWNIQDGVTAHEAAKNYLGAKTGETLQYKYSRTNSTNVADSSISTVNNGVYSDYTSNLTALLPGTYTFKGDASYSASSEPLYDSKGVSGSPKQLLSDGGEVDNPPTAGSMSASTVLNVSLPIFATSGATGGSVNLSGETYNAVGVSKIPLKTWAAQGTASSGGWTVDFPGCTNEEKKRRLIFTPRKIKYYEKDLAGNLTNDASSKFKLETSTVTVTLNGYNFAYYKYVWNGGATGGNQGRIIML